MHQKVIVYLCLFLDNTFPVAHSNRTVKAFQLLHLHRIETTLVGTYLMLAFFVIKDKDGLNKISIRLVLVCLLDTE